MHDLSIRPSILLLTKLVGGQLLVLEIQVEFCKLKASHAVVDLHSVFEFIRFVFV